jgi:hypothetical protein
MCSRIADVDRRHVLGVTRKHEAAHADVTLEWYHTSTSEPQALVAGRASVGSYILAQRSEAAACAL